MRTTISIDDDVLEEVRNRAEKKGETVSQVVSELLRWALRDEESPIEYPGDFRPFPRRPGQRRVTMELVNRLRDELP